MHAQRSRWRQLSPLCSHAYSAAMRHGPRRRSRVSAILPRSTRYKRSLLLRLHNDRIAKKEETWRLAPMLGEFMGPIMMILLGYGVFAPILFMPAKAENS